MGLLSRSGDLWLVLIVLWLSVISYLSGSVWARTAFVILFLILLPGYAAISALFPSRDLALIERFTLGAGMGIAIAVFVGFILSVTPLRLRPEPLSLVIGALTLFLVVIAWVRRRMLPEEVVFQIKVQPKGEGDFGAEFERVLIYSMVVLVIFGALLLAGINMTRQNEAFTSLYILNEDGNATDYPSLLRAGEPVDIRVVVENHEYEPVQYELLVMLNDETLQKESLYLKHGEIWDGNFTFTLSQPIPRSKLEFRLLKGGEVYRSVHLWVKSI